jgi:DNA-binding NarL/FixJ family response regulator
VVEAVIEVHTGHCYLCPAIAHFIVETGLMGKKVSRKRGAVPVALTGQERKVLQLIAEGRSTKEIAAVLHLSVHTIHAHRKSVMAKLNVHKQAGLVRYAIKTGIAKL